jgi:hypothetical protein
MSSHRDSHTSQQLSHKIGRARFSKRQLRVLVQVPPPAYKLRSQTFGLGPEFCDCHESLKPP